MTSRIDANDTPPARQLVLPAVPIITTVQGIRRSNPSTSPVNPSPLRESAVTAAIGVMTVQDTPVATPVADDKSSGKLLDYPMCFVHHLPLAWFLLASTVSSRLVSTIENGWSYCKTRFPPI